ncbi:DUF1513 domain-containing protein [Vibrio sp. TH_r3]|uniref:DUF1513 domain-containing protein n=1 Tax=Vibrio sp. TH_r3 TaxID=3082084 RepID=UPI002952BEF4|nr:DUF1513 domain-containing protein [Vibrio sp. TH_r3]MDV7102845.1 DUF1513 domain-containing protein [Vibrio sp. TH_r3]
MAIDSTRRNLIKAALLASISPMSQALPLISSTVATSRKVTGTGAFIGCAVDSSGQYTAVVASENGAPVHSITLPARGHGIAVSPNQLKTEAVVFARRPGVFFQVIDYVTGERLPFISAQPNRHFYGHGAYSNDGNWLFVTEGESKTSAGIIGVYDATNSYKKVEELTGFGIGPHEIRVLDNDDIVVAVGGVHTNGRRPLNLESMLPALCYFNSKGQLSEQVSLSDKKLSIRHLCTPSSSMVISGQQYRGDTDDTPPLIAVHKRGQAFYHLQAEDEQWARFNHYIASIEVVDDLLLATSPRGNCYGIWSLADNQLLEIDVLPEASGVVKYKQGFFVSSGSGRVAEISRSGDSHLHKTSVLWDNHLARLG